MKALQILCCLLPFFAGAQARLVLNGARMNITNGAQLVIDNSAANALTRYDGYIISEGENNMVRWNIGTVAGTYTVPLGYGTAAYLPVAFTKDAGNGNGSFSFATYQTPWRNSEALPTGITHVVLNGSDNSSFISDRFWKIRAAGYTNKPSLSNLSFTYLDAENASPNVIAESNLQARRWNNTAQTWTDYLPTATVNTTSKTVTLAAVPAEHVDDWWLVADNVNVLPVHWLKFAAVAEGNSARLNWVVTADEPDLTFTIERSVDASNFTAVGRVPAMGNVGTMQSYAFLDNNAFSGRSFYRIRQSGGSNKISYSPVRNVFINKKQPVFAVYPNPVTDRLCTVNLQSHTLKQVRLQLLTMSGAVTLTQAFPDEQQFISLQVPSGLAPGLYTLKIYTSQRVMQQQLLIR